ncbi:MAG: hypothetical protein IJE97_10865 [Thermoguttaceae bacterium]|nr:hypothetical protein [Thermoguttaceae bacterium]MBQ6826700.1 hypothetical protein [Thermoguttaceae bacterium]
MKFFDAMKAMEAGEVVRIKGSVSYFVKPTGLVERWSVIFEDGTPSLATGFFYSSEVESDDWEVVANPPKQLAERAAAFRKEQKRQ